MPYKIKKVKDGFKVCKADDPSKCFSKKPMTKENAEKQMRAIIMSEQKGGAIPTDPELYEKVKEEVYENNPKHSAYRSMMIAKKYKEEGGKYKDDGDKNKMNTRKWLGQKWSSVNDYYHNDEVVECGNTDTQKKFGEYPLCRPLKIIKSLSKEQMKEMIDKKDELGKSQLITKKVLGTKKFNIKNTKTGMGELYGTGSFCGGLKPLTARVGGKVLLKKKLVDEYFLKPSEYNTYVEPFVGAGAVYFYKDKDDKKEVINDIDGDLIDLYKGFQKYEPEKIRNSVNGNYTEAEFRRIKNSKPEDAYNKFIKLLKLYRLSFFGRGLNFGKDRISSTFEGYKDRLRGVSIYNKDYKDIIRQFDSPKTFFYLDPPVVGHYGVAKFTPPDVEELAELLHKIKGKFLLTLAEPKIDKSLFKGFEIKTVPTKYVGENTTGGQTKKATEYIITNYKPKLSGSGHSCSGCLGACGGAVSKFHKKLGEIGLSPKKYLDKAKELAKETGYDPDKVMFCDKDNKLMYDSPDGMRHFGNPDYSDYIIWTWLEHKGEVPEGTADERRRLYRARATNIKGNWKDDKYSPNNLAINILW